MLKPRAEPSRADGGGRRGAPAAPFLPAAWCPGRQPPAGLQTAEWIGARIAVDPWCGFSSSPRSLSGSLPGWHLGCWNVPRFKYKCCGLGDRAPCSLQGKEVPGSPTLTQLSPLSLSVAHTYTPTRAPSLGIFYDLLFRCQFDSIPIRSYQCLLFAGSCKSDRNRGERDLPQIFSGTLFYLFILIFIYLSGCAGS